MLAIISPAKKLNVSEVSRDLPQSEPMFAKNIRELMATTRELSRGDIKNLMHISDTLVELNYGRYQDFTKKSSKASAKQAIMTFAGDTYVGLQADTFDDDDMAFAQDHLRILSGLYGLLRPLDMIQAYRLEMGIRLKTEGQSDLYGFWGDKLGKMLDKEVASHKAPVLVNLASVEYFKATQPKTRKARIVTPVFKEEKEGVAKVIGIFAKQARGSMARYIIRNRLENLDDLKSFDTGDYQYQPHASDDETWVFTRKS